MTFHKENIWVSILLQCLHWFQFSTIAFYVVGQSARDTELASTTDKCKENLSFEMDKANSSAENGVSLPWNRSVVVSLSKTVKHSR